MANEVVEAGELIDGVIEDSDAVVSRTLVAEIHDDKGTAKRLVTEDTLVSIADELGKLLQKCIADKEPIERRWLQCVIQYHGQEYQQEQAGLPENFNETTSVGEGKTRSNIYVNITRPKTDAAEARMSDMLFPSDDKNWGISPTPVPDLVGALRNENNVELEGEEVLNKDKSTDEEEVPLKEGDLAQAQMDDVRERSEKMEQQIEDQFTDCRYSAESRDMLKDNVQLGTGIIKGPMQVGVTRRAWVAHKDSDGSEAYMLEIKQTIQPYVYRVSPWNWFPDMRASKVSDCEYTFEIHYKTSKQMLELLKTRGFMKSQVRKVLEQGITGANGYNTSNYLEQLRTMAGVSTVGYAENRYRLVEYHGPLKKEFLNSLGMELDEDDTIEEQEGFVWFVDNIVVKIAIHHLDSEDKLYSVVNWIRDDATLFGYGVPYALRATQKVISAAWRMILDNAGLSAGPQIVINQAIVEPADGDWEITPRKVWLLNDDEGDVNKAFKIFDIGSRQQELMQIFLEAKKLAEEETNLPMVSQGMQGTAGRTFSGLSMVMNASNIMLRRAVKYYDDDVAVPVVRRFYDWNMQFNPDNSIKGDFSVKARGSSVLMVKEMQSQGLMTMMQFVEHPILGRKLNIEGMLNSLAKSLYVGQADILKDKETIKQEDKDEAERLKNQPQVSPDVQAKIDAQIQVASINAQSKGNEMQLALMQLQSDQESLIATLASKESVAAEQIIQKYNISVANQEWDMEKFAAELMVKRDMGTGI